jgi:hypothetical protein
MDKQKVRTLPDNELLTEMAHYTPASDHAAKHELLRQDHTSANLQSWIAIGIALLSLVISIAAFFH